MNELNNEGIALVKQGELDEAIECYDKALEIDSKYEVTWVIRGLH